MRTQIIALCVLGSALSCPAFAAEGTGPYVEIAGGTSWANAIRFDVATTPNPTASGIIVKHKTGKDLSIALGHDFGFFRVEAEAAERDAPPSSLVTKVIVPISRLAGANAPVTRAGTLTPIAGTSRARSAMVNLYLQTGDPEVTRFFVGAGAGYGRSYAHGYAMSTTAEVVRDHDGGKAWQFLAGAREPIGTHATIGVRYRYYHPDKMQVTDTLGRTLTGRLITHSIQASLGWRF